MADQTGLELDLEMLELPENTEGLPEARLAPPTDTANPQTPPPPPEPSDPRVPESDDDLHQQLTLLIAAKRKKVLKDFGSLTPREQLILLDARGISTVGEQRVYTDRFVRYEIRQIFGPRHASWNPAVDDAVNPVTRAGFQGRPEESYHMSRTLDELVTGQTLGRYRAPITLNQSDLEVSMDASQHNRSTPARVYQTRVTFGVPVTTHVPVENDSFLPQPYNTTATAATTAQSTLPAPMPSRQSQPITQPNWDRPSAQSTYHVDGGMLGPERVLSTIPVATTAQVTNTTTSWTTTGTASCPTGRAYSSYRDPPITSNSYRPLPTEMPPQTCYGLSEPDPRRPSEEYRPAEQAQSNNSYWSHPNNVTHTVHSSTLAELIGREFRVYNVFESEGISFGGADHEDPHFFLTRVEECVENQNLSEAEMLRALPTTFKGDAAPWYRLERRNIRTKRDFVQAFRLTFCPRNHEANLRKDIERRTQAESQSNRSYVLNMRGPFANLSTPPPDLLSQLDIVHSQLHPKYMLEVPRRSFNSYQELLDAGQTYETTMLNRSRYRPPPPPEESYVPTFAYAGRETGLTRGRKTQSHNHAIDAQNVAGPSPLPRINQGPPPSGRLRGNQRKLGAKTRTGPATNRKCPARPMLPMRHDRTLLPRMSIT
uniref:Retrotransposon gag domain-containing protein n=1 Tax=Bracon brevicornis TaxID=1563983 RepID=A0A6V7JGF4_9HYME